MESSWQVFFIDMVVDRCIFKNIGITLSLCFAFVPKTGVGLPKTWVSFYCKQYFKDGIFDLISSLFFTHSLYSIAMNDRLVG